MNATYDAIVLGADPNGLAAATLLARAGRRILVLEERSAVGGLWAGAEFHPGYRHVGVHHDSDTVRPWVVEALGLASHGLVFTARPDVALHGGGIVPRPPVDPFRAAIAAVFDAPAPGIGPQAPLWPALRMAARARRALGANSLLDLLRILPDSAESWLSAPVPDPRSRAAVALGGLIGTFMGPFSPQSAGIVLLREALADRAVAGGPAAVVDACDRAARAAGAEIRCGVHLEQIEVIAGRVWGVRTREGTFASRLVLSALDPKRTGLHLLSPMDVPPRWERDLHNVRVRPTSAKMHIAVNGPVRLNGIEGPVAAFRVVRDPIQLERAFDDAKHGRLPSEPALDVRVPSVATAGLAPDGHAVLSIHVYGVPAHPSGGWTREARAKLELNVWSAVREALSTPVDAVGTELLVPPDLEERYGVSGGHLMHGELALDQLWVGRPSLASSGGATPISGLWLASAGVHPGAWLAGASGVVVARRALEQP